MNLVNLKRMYNHILLNVPDNKINMSIYRSNNYKISHKCGSSGCVIGHCIVLDEWKNVPKNNISIDFARWSENFTGINLYSYIWYWCFSSSWSNNKEQILLRLKYFIDNKKYPDDWVDYNYLLPKQELEPYELS